VVDTVVFFAPHELRSQYCGRSPQLPEGWELGAIRNSREIGEYGVVERETRIFKHRDTGLRAIGDDVEVKKVEVSLPRVLHGSNGRLIKDASELDNALCRTLRIVRQLGIPTTLERYWFNRVDLVWHFKGRLADFVKAHWHLRHKRVRKQTGHYDGQSLYWPGNGFRVRMYDKELEMNGTPGEVVRVEVQLRGKRLYQLFGVESGQLTILDFAKCYEVYRNIVLEFQPAPLADVKGILEILAICERNGWNENGVGMLDLWARNKNPRYARHVRAKVGKIVLQRSTINWAELLPEAGPPDPVEVEAGLEP
jgi:hypothetical protein